LSPPAQNQGAFPTATEDRFRAAYRRRGSPRIAIFWNRSLTDQVDADHIDVESERGLAAVVGDTPPTMGIGVVSARDRMTAKAQIGSGAHVRVLKEPDAWRVEQGFESQLQKAGARLVDRNAIVRLAGTAAGAAPDIQRVEVSALKGYADILVEILAARDSGSSSGYLFRATAKDVRDGRILADVTSDGLEKPAATEWVATARGFEKREHPTETPSGAPIARLLMDRLSSAWAP
jgi:hypothetical protein